jgi:hypothetical protein
MARWALFSETERLVRVMAATWGNVLGSGNLPVSASSTPTVARLAGAGEGAGAGGFALEPSACPKGLRLLQNSREPLQGDLTALP